MARGICALALSSLVHSPSHGIIDVGGPLVYFAILACILTCSTTVVNAVLWNSSFTGNLTTHTFVFPADVPSQPRNYQTLGDIGVTQSLAIQGVLERLLFLFD